jgi:hypothetical protein
MDFKRTPDEQYVWPYSPESPFALATLIGLGVLILGVLLIIRPKPPK